MARSNKPDPAGEKLTLAIDIGGSHLKAGGTQRRRRDGVRASAGRDAEAG